MLSYEIGSHFEFDSKMKLKGKENTDWLPNATDTAMTFSGRAAIELAIRDMKMNHKIKSVYMPSYCCYSMIAPFINHNINIIYYDVEHCYKDGISYDINLAEDCDVFFAMSYFGLEDFKLNFAIESFLRRGKTIIEDITHRLLCKEAYSNMAHYSIASIRKWLPVPTGGYIAKQSGSLSHKPHLESDHLVLQKIKAMEEKHQYLCGDNIDKNSYLDKFAEFERKFGSLDSTYMIDNLSLDIIKNLDIEKVRTSRRNNARILYDSIETLPHIKPLIPTPNLENDCPLFVPVMIETEKRDDLRKYLIENNIYCPVHWPHKDQMSSKIPENELSLICDQRYTEADMEYIIKVIERWTKKYIS